MISSATSEKMLSSSLFSSDILIRPIFLSTSPFVGISAGGNSALGPIISHESSWRSILTVSGHEVIVDVIIQYNSCGLKLI